MKNLIINADEFGLTKSVSRGILEAFYNGIVTNTTIMVNMPSSKYAFELIKKHPDLKVGVHLNLTDGKPVLSSDKVRTLVDKYGFFLDLKTLLIRIISKRIDYNEVEAELRAQVKKTLDNGIKITHLDGHRHIHMYPKILKRAIRVAKEFGIDKMRYSYEHFSLNLMDNLLSFSFIKKGIVSFYSILCKNLLIKNNIKFNKYFLGMSQLGAKNSSKAFKKILHLVKNGTTELICHPAYIDDELKRINPYVYPREKELKALTSPAVKELIKKLDINLISYDDL